MLLHMWITLGLETLQICFYVNYIRIRNVTNLFLLKLIFIFQMMQLLLVKENVCFCYHTIEKGYIQKRRQRSSLLFGGQNLFNSLPGKLFSSRMIKRKVWIAPEWYKEKDELHQDDTKKRMNCTRMLQYKEKDELPILQIVRVQNNERVKKLNKFWPPNNSDDLLFCINPFSM